ncbi:putative damage-inducible protein DinB [Alteromonadaceae bacterium 2753L.S.0a.02]|nr:putative damage-inducible protein DinB [Alteromonadaceae bacterium 2753L.S.0a.02]
MKNLFQYKAWANAELLYCMALISKEQFPEQWTTAIRLLNHTLVVDKIFIAHIQQLKPEYTASNTPETPTLKALGESINETDNWLIQYVAGLNSDLLDKELCFRFTDGDNGRMSLSEILNHLLIHGAYHRGNIGMVLTACGIERPRDIFTRFLHAEEPGRRLNF